MENELWTVKDVAAFFKMKAISVYKMVKDGKLKPLRHSEKSSMRFNPEDVKKIFAQ